MSKKDEVAIVRHEDGVYRTPADEQDLDWTDTRVLMHAIQQVLRRLVRGEISVEQARAESAALRNAVALVKEQVEVAKARGKISDDPIPKFNFG